MDQLQNTSAATKQCPGYPAGGLAPHEAPATREYFTADKSKKDGLWPQCKACANAYQRAWREAKAGKPGAPAQGLTREQRAGHRELLAKAKDQDRAERQVRKAQEDAARVPALRDPVVVDGIKYRIVALGEGRAEAREHFKPHREVTVAVSGMTWDRVAGVWRGQAVVSPLRTDVQDQAPRYADGLAAQVGEGSMTGWTLSVVAGVAYALPTDATTIGTEEGQAALDAVNEAKRARDRAYQAERRRAAKQEAAQA